MKAEGANVAPERTQVSEDQGKMARLEGETSNALFKELEAWEAQLKPVKQELDALQRQPKGPSL